MYPFFLWSLIGSGPTKYVQHCSGLAQSPRQAVEHWRGGGKPNRDTGLLWSRTTDKQQKKAPPEVTDDAIYRRPAGAIGGRGSAFFSPWGLWGLCQSKTEVLSFFPLFCIELLILDLSVGVFLVPFSSYRAGPVLSALWYHLLGILGFPGQFFTVCLFKGDCFIRWSLCYYWAFSFLAYNMNKPTFLIVC